MVNSAHRFRRIILHFALMGTCLWSSYVYSNECEDRSSPTWTRNVSLEQSQKAILIVQQNGTDVTIAIESQFNEFLVDSPTNKYGKDFVFLQSSDSSDSITEYNICTFPRFNLSVVSPPDIQVIALDDESLALSSFLELINEAGTLWSSAEPENQEAAINVYARLAEQLKNQAYDSELTELSKYMSYYAALGSFNFYNYQDVISYLDGIENLPNSGFLKHAIPFLRVRARLPELRYQDQAILDLEELISNTEELYSKDIARMYSLLGEVFLENQGFDAGEENILKAIELAAEGDEELLSDLYNNLGYISVMNGRRARESGERERQFNLSITQHEIALAYAELSGNFRSQAIILNNIGTLYERLGELVLAQRYYAAGLNIAEGQVSGRSVALNYKNLGEIYNRLGDLPKAEAFLNVALARMDQAQSNFRSEILCSLGSVKRAQNQIEEAIRLHSECRIFARDQLNNSITEAESLYELSQDFILLGDLNNAVQSLAAARLLLDSDDNFQLDIADGAKHWIRILAAQAMVFALSGESQHQVGYLVDEVSSLLDSQFDESISLEALSHILKTQLASNNSASAIITGLKAINIVESVHENLETERLSPSWSSKNNQIYLDVINSILSERELESISDIELDQLFNVVERSRAAGLRRSLVESQLREDLEFEPDNSRLSRLSEIANIRAQEQNLRNVNLAVDQYQQHEILLSDNIEAYRSISLSSPVTLEYVQNNLLEDQIVLHYVSLQSEFYVFVITRDELKLEKLEKPRQLNEKIVDLREQIVSSAPIDSELIQQISVIIPSEIASIGKSNLIVVPHQEINAIPFSLLELPTGEALLDKFSITMVPSLSAMFIQRPQEPYSEEHSEIAIFADPIFSTEDNQLSERESTLRSWSNSLRRLPWTAEEARALAELYSDNVVTSFIGYSANKLNLYDPRSRNASILHIATHGYFADESPDNVGFILSSSSPDSTGGSEFVTLTELSNYRFDNQLVVVSGCETGLGMQLNGEGSLSISRAFLASGSERVLSTLWPVSDRASAIFMALFYEDLKESGDASVSLKFAQQEMMKTSQYAHPFYWAGYVLHSTKASQRIEIPLVGSLLN